MTCNRCGSCCIELADKLMWVGGNLTWQEKQTLLKEREKYPPSDGCQMLYFKEQAHCLLYTMGWQDKRDRNCINYRCDKWQS